MSAVVAVFFLFPGVVALVLVAKTVATLRTYTAGVVLPSRRRDEFFSSSS